MKTTYDRCPTCGGSKTYPLLMSADNPRTICADEFHRKWFDFAFHPGLWKLIRRMLEGW